jgi:hypothetical protein
MQLLLRSTRVCVSNLELLPHRLATYYHNNLGWVSGRCLLLCVQKVNIHRLGLFFFPLAFISHFFFFFFRMENSF